MNVVVRIDGSSVAINVPLALRPGWKETWVPGEKLDVWTAMRTTFDGVVEGEIEISNASIVVGVKSSTKSSTSASVSLGYPEDYEIAWDCERPWPTLWPTKKATFRRFALYPSNRPDLFAVALAKARGSYKREWFGNRTSFGPADMPLPVLNHTALAAQTASYTDHHQNLYTALRSSTPYYVEDTEDGAILPNIMGWRVWGPNGRGNPGGSGIHFSTGWQQNLPWLNMAVLAAECCHERSWVAYSRVTGKPVTVDDYPGPWSPDYAPGSGDVNNNELPEFTGVQNTDPLPLPFDPAHSIRGFRHMIALSEIMDSPMIRRAIAGAAAQARLTYTERGKPPAYGYMPTNLSNHLAIVKQNPGKGLFGLQLGRIVGWPMWIMAQHIKVNGGSTGDRQWASKMLELAETAAMPTGICQRVVRPDPPPGTVDVWYNPNWDTAQSFEASIFWHGATALALQLGRPLPQGAVEAAYSLLIEAPKRAYYSSEMGPPHFVFVAARGGEPVPEITDGQSGDPGVPGDSTHMEDLSALLMQHDFSNQWRDASITVGSTFNTWQEKWANIAVRFNMNNTASLLAQYQLEGKG